MAEPRWVNLWLDITSSAMPLAKKQRTVKGDIRPG